MIKKFLFLSICIISLNLYASGDIVLKDDSKNTKMVQKNIVGCDENPTIQQQKKDIAEIKSKLSDILAKLSALEKETDSKSKTRQISSLKKSITKLNKKTKNYIIVRVKRGDRLSDYAKKYYGNKRKYYRIYRANQDKIGSNLQLRVGDRIIIPLSKNYKYKKFKKRKKYKRKVKHKHIVHKPIDKVVNNREIIVEKPKVEYSMAKYITPSQEDSTVKMLDEVIYIDDENKPTDTSDFIPLDEN